MEELISVWKTKLQYSDYIINLLLKIVKAMILYYGKNRQQAIFESLKNCEIHFQKENEEPESYLNQYFGVNRSWDIPDLSASFYHKELYLKDGILSSKQIIYIRQMYLGRYVPFSYTYDNDSKLAELVHELCHLVKSNGLERIEEGVVVDPCGLSKDIYRYDEERKKLVTVENKYLGIEEALNSFDEARIMTLITGREHKVGSYKAMSRLAGRLMQYPDVKKEIQDCQFTGNDTWIDYLGEEGSYLLIEQFDIMCNAMYQPLSIISNDRKRKELVNQITDASIKVEKWIEEYDLDRQVAKFK